MQETTEAAIDLRELLLILSGGIRRIFLAAAAGMLIALAVTQWLTAPEYVSSVLMYVHNASEDVRTDDTVRIDDITASQKLVNSCIVIMQDDEVLKPVIDRLTERYPEEFLEENLRFTRLKNGERVLLPETLREDVVTMTAVNNTEILRIEAKTKNPELSAEICSAVTELSPDVLRRVIKAGSVEVIGEAEAAETPSSPNRILNLGIGFFAGALLSAASLLIRSVMGNRITDERNLRKRLDISVLGTVPDSRDKGSFFRMKNSRGNAPEQESSLMLTSEKSFGMQEAYRKIRTNLLFSLADGMPHTVVVSAILPGGEKSEICANLAVSMAQTRAKVLLIDANLYDPVQHRFFRCDNSKGLSAVLEKSCSLDEAVIHNVKPDLDLIPAGKTLLYPPKLLEPHPMKQLLEKAEESYDMVLIDSPPMCSAADAALLAKSAAGLVTVVRQGAVTYDELAEEMRKMKLADARLLGVVIYEEKRNLR